MNLPRDPRAGRGATGAPGSHGGARAFRDHADELARPRAPAVMAHSKPHYALLFRDRLCRFANAQLMPQASLERERERSQAFA